MSDLRSHILQEGSKLIKHPATNACEGVDFPKMEVYSVNSWMAPNATVPFGLSSPEHTDAPKQMNTHYDIKENITPISDNSKNITESLGIKSENKSLQEWVPPDTTAFCDATVRPIIPFNSYGNDENSSFSFLNNNEVESSWMDEHPFFSRLADISNSGQGLSTQSPLTKQKPNHSWTTPEKEVINRLFQGHILRRWVPSPCRIARTLFTHDVNLDKTTGSIRSRIRREIKRNQKEEAGTKRWSIALKEKLRQCFGKYYELTEKMNKQQYPPTIEYENAIKCNEEFRGKTVSILRTRLQYELKRLLNNSRKLGKEKEVHDMANNTPSRDWNPIQTDKLRRHFHHFYELTTKMRRPTYPFHFELELAVQFVGEFREKTPNLLKNKLRQEFKKLLENINEEEAADDCPQKSPLQLSD